MISIALELARSADVEHKWKTVGDAALAAWDLALAEECFTHAKDLGSLLLLRSASSDAKGLTELAEMAEAAGQHNVSFLCYWQLGNVDACIDHQVKTGRTAEAVLFSQTYKPSRTPAVAGAWRKGIEEKGRSKVARMLGMPPGVTEEGITADEDMFPEWDEYLQIEKAGGKEEQLIDVEETAPEETNGVNGDASEVEAAEGTKDDVE